MLEVGALKPDNYQSCSSWVAWTPIDLHSRHPDILEQDFLAMDPEQHTNKFDAISLSLVLNFMPSLINRGTVLSWLLVELTSEAVCLTGKALRLAHLFLKTEGFLFLAVSSSLSLSYGLIPELDLLSFPSHASRIQDTWISTISRH